VNTRDAVHRLRASGCWKPSNAAFLLRSRAPRSGDVPSDDEALQAAAAWLARAHDATRDGGIAGRYRLSSGWSSSYPETTGYTIPTWLRLAEILHDQQYRQRAKRCVDFLLSAQLPSGAFPGLEIADNRTEPSPFNSAQIIHGLHRWHLATGDRTVLDPIVRGGRWICDVQDADGAWRQFFYRRLACAYSAHAACWLGEIGDGLDEPRFRDAAKKNLEWVLSLRDAQTGWFDRAGFSERDHEQRCAHTHTIAYTLDGVLRMSQRFGNAEGLDAVRVAAERLLERFERSNTLAGVINYQWRPHARYVCLTGDAQMALIWLELARSTRDVRFVNAAFKAIDEVKRAQTIAHSDPGIRGGIPGSWPIGGDYIPFALPNWAAKFFIDALCAKRDCLANWLDSVRVPLLTATEARTPATAGELDPGQRRRVAVYTTRVSPKFATLAARWCARGFAPSLVLIETGGASRARRLWSALRHADDSARICRAHGWRYRYTPSVNAHEAVRAVEHIRPLVAVAAGAGILKGRILAAPRLGTLNAHMGLLPAYRGMNAAEWSVFHGDPAGCSVFWMDDGIDTGPIIATSIVVPSGSNAPRSIAELRERVDALQLDLLDATLQSIVDRGTVPAGVVQRLEEGRQFFRMHEDLRRLFEGELARGGYDRTGAFGPSPGATMNSSPVAHTSS
jgi:folate-dependent phosphoribosylglycinamide formyltransferase PurN